MNFYNHYGLKIAGVLMFVACACVPQGRAQRSSAFDGEFSLSEPVIWQGKILPAGDYTFSVTSKDSTAKLVLHGPKATVVILPSGRSDGAANHHSAIIIEQRGKTRFVRELSLNNPSVAFRYQVPSLPKNESAQQAPGTELVAITRAPR